MSIPTPEELGELVYGVMRDASGSIPFAPGLNALTELIGIAVRDAVLDGAAQVSEKDTDNDAVMVYPTDTLYHDRSDWIRSLKGDQP